MTVFHSDIKPESFGKKGKLILIDLHNQLKFQILEKDNFFKKNFL